MWIKYAHNSNVSNKLKSRRYVINLKSENNIKRKIIIIYAFSL